MTTERDLSERLDELATLLESIVDSDSPQTVWEVAQELRKLSNEKYTPGSVSWADVKKQVNLTSTKKVYRDASNREMPF